MSEKLRLPAEESYAAELKALAAGDSGPRPPGWALSPRSVVTYLMGGKAGDGTVITPKYVGDRRLIETAVATLATDRALLLLGVPGTAKSLGVGASRRRRSPAIRRSSSSARPAPTKTRSAMAGTTRSCSRKGRAVRRWSPTPLMRAMEGGKLVPLRGADAHGLGRAGHADHRALREDDAGPGAQHRDLCAARLQHHRHRQQPRQGRQRTVLGAEAPLQRRRAAAARHMDGGGRDRRQARRRDGRRASTCRRRRTSAEEVARVVAIFRELRSGATRTARWR